jgi:hypothetical protein
VHPPGLRQGIEPDPGHHTHSAKTAVEESGTRKRNAQHGGSLTPEIATTHASKEKNMLRLVQLLHPTRDAANPA